MKTLLALVISLAAFAPSLTLACGGGAPIKLNDDAILRPEGLFAPITDPKDKKAVLIEEVVGAHEKCVRQSNNLAAALFGGACPSTTYEVTDSKGVKTHEVAMIMPDAYTAVYHVKDMKGVTKVYQAQLHTRGGCGLAEVKR